MDRDPGDFEDRSADVPSGTDHDAIDARIAALSPCPHLDRTPEEDAAAIKEAREDFAAGRGVPHSEVAKWLKTWGTPDFKPMPAEWLK